MTTESLDFHAQPGRFTSVGNLMADGSATSTTELVRRAVDVLQGLLVYDLVAEPFYGVELPARQAEAIHERDSARLLALVSEIDDRPLDQPRAPQDRVGARCHSYSRMTVALLRAAGVPARARCGFAGYFRPGWFEDHWVAEYWDVDPDAGGSDGRWRMVDAQLDDVWRRNLGIDEHGLDPLDVSPSQFVTAGHAWRAWRSGELDAGRCGLSAIDEHGAHWIAGNLRVDLAALNKVEMLPWDLWGTGWEPGEEPTPEQFELFDTVAELTTDSDRRFAELRDRYDTDDRLRMDGTVFSVLRQQIEQVG